MANSPTRLTSGFVVRLLDNPNTPSEIPSLSGVIGEYRQKVSAATGCTRCNRNRAKAQAIAKIQAVLVNSPQPVVEKAKSMMGLAGHTLEVYVKGGGGVRLKHI